MVLNSTVIANECVADSSVKVNSANTTNLVVNTTDFNKQDFKEFLNISEGIERHNRQRRSNRRSRNNTIIATMTREELFESTNVDDDQFLNALENQNFYNDLSMNKSVMLNSIDNLMKYFDEDIAVDDNSLKFSPAKLKTKGKVASVVASLRSKAGNLTPSPLSKRKNKQKLVVNTNIQELKKRYELTPDVSASKSSKALKLSPKFSRKSKVKQMAILFNTKMNSFMRKDSPERLEQQEPISPGLESIASPSFTSTLKPPKSPKLKPKLPTYTAKLPCAKPSPLFKRKQLQRSPSIASLTGGSPFTRRKQQLQKQPSATCLVAENVFSQLSVKDKALLYNKFIGDMSKQNPKFSKHAQVLESNVQKEIARGEVVIEKQGTVKHIRDSLEAKFTPTKSVCKTLQRFKRSPSEFFFNTPPKSREYEDVVRSETPETPTTPLPNANEDPLHVSTLTVVLKSSPDSKKCVIKPRNHRKKRDVRFLTDLGNIEPSFKRTQGMIRSSVQVEPFAPPKKIRRTQHERLAPKMFFQNQYLEKLFYNWLKEKNGVSFDITPLDNRSDIIEIVPKNSKDNIIPKHKVDRLLEEAINKLEAENKKAEQNTEEYAIKLIKKTVEDEVERSVIEVELPLEVQITKAEGHAKEAEQEDSNLGLTSIDMTTSEESLTEISKEMENVKVVHNSSLKSSKPMRKKKLRRSLTWKKELSLVESNPIVSTDSDSDCKMQQHNKSHNSSTLPKSKKCSNYVKKLLFKTINSPASSVHSHTPQPELSIGELDRSLIRQVNLPSKIKDAYTLTVMSSPSPPAESDFCDSDLPHTPIRDISRSWPSIQEACLAEEEVQQHQQQQQLNGKAVSTKLNELAKNNKVDSSYIDQGFETGSTDMDSPMRLNRKPPAPLKLDQKLDLSLTKLENPKNFSTPLKDAEVQHQVFTAQLVMAGAQNFLSPILANTPMHRKNPSMQVIKEDCTLEDYSHSQQQYTPSSINESDTFFASDANDHSTTSPLGVTQKVETSQFWITTGDFTAALNIHYYEPERLMLLSNIFGQKCMEHRDMTFGIDKLKFSLDQGTTACSEELLRKIPKLNNCSQYWFSTGDVLLPFAGKQISQQKVEIFFAYIREFMDDGSTLRFGIDTYEFSNIHQSDFTDDFASSTWPRASPVKTSDLDHSDFESVELEQSLSYSGLGVNQSDSASLKSEELMHAIQTYLTHAETVAMQQIFDDTHNKNLSKTQTDKFSLETQISNPEILKTLQNQQLKLKQLEERMLNCAPSAYGKTIENFNDSPEYMRKLRLIISTIDNIGRGNEGFNVCSIEQLESFMYFLSRYADLCLANCTAHIEKILDVVMHQRTIHS